MPSLTLKGLPDPVYRALKERAATNRRSLNSEVIVRLERSIATEPVDVAERLARIDAIRARVRAHIEQTGLPLPTEEEITAAKHEGRP